MNPRKGSEKKTCHVSVPLALRVVETLDAMAQRYEVTRAEIIRRMIVKSLEEMQ